MKTKKILYIAVIVVLLVIFLVSAFRVGAYFIDAKQQGDRYNDLAAMVEQAKQEQSHKSETEDEPEETMSEDQEPTEPEMLPEYAALYELNPDMVGWLKIEDSGVNYPVMMSPEDPDFYLKHNFDGVRNAHGCIFIKVGDVNEPSDNLTLYGHNMGDGSMFTDVFRYQVESFMEEHRFIQFDTLYEHHTYEVFAVFTTTATLGKGFQYHNVVDVDEASFNQFIEICKDLSFFDLGITPEYGDKIICLSTCEYSQPNGRLVVAAVRID